MTVLTDAPALADAPAPEDALGATGTAVLPEPRGTVDAATSTAALSAPATPPAPVVPVTVTVCGALDLATVARVRERMEQALSARPARLVVDLSGCPFVDASALAMLLEAHRRLARSGGVLALQGCCPRVLRLLSLTGLRRVFELV